MYMDDFAVNFTDFKLFRVQSGKWPISRYLASHFRYQEAMIRASICFPDSSAHFKKFAANRGGEMFQFLLVNQS